MRCLYRLPVALLMMVPSAMTSAQSAPSCPPAHYDRPVLDRLKAQGWAIESAATRNAFALALTPCLASRDPSLRDGIAFDALQRLMRARQLTDDTMRALQDDLERRLVAPEGMGVERPFAALTLAEVARADRMQPYLTSERRHRLVTAGTAYLQSVRDYRGFDDRDGWRHGVAHGADLMLQLTLNATIGKSELERIRDAIAAQVSPSAHAYVFGESERLMTPIVYMARRGLFTEAEWTAWFATLATPTPFESWDGTFASEAKLRKRHNLAAFLTLTALNVRMSADPADDILLPGAEAALRALP